MALIPVVAGVWYFGYNVGAVYLFVTDDAMDDFDRLDITFSEVAVHSTGALTASAWVGLDLEQTTVDLTKLRDDTTARVGFETLPAGTYTQVRLLVTSSTGVLKTGETVSVTVPGGELRANTPFDLEPQGTVSITLRIHVVKAGPVYQLAPVLGSVVST
jgi:hypothetical protein